MFLGFFFFHWKRKEEKRTVDMEIRKFKIKTKKHLLSSGAGVGSGFGVCPGKKKIM